MAAVHDDISVRQTNNKNECKRQGHIEKPSSNQDGVAIALCIVRPLLLKVM